MTSILLPLMMLLGADESAAAPKTPAGAIETMHEVLEKKDYRAFYQHHCHAHLRRQLAEDRFVQDMQGDMGTQVIKLMAAVNEAIAQKLGPETLIARPQDDPEEYEFILPKARRATEAMLWHIELKKENGVWKLKDVD